MTAIQLTNEMTAIFRRYLRVFKLCPDIDLMMLVSLVEEVFDISRNKRENP